MMKTPENRYSISPAFRVFTALFMSAGFNEVESDTLLPLPIPWGVSLLKLMLKLFANHF